MSCPGVGLKECGRATKQDGFCGIHHPERMAQMRRPCAPATTEEVKAIRDAYVRTERMRALEREFWRLHNLREGSAS